MGLSISATSSTVAIVGTVTATGSALLTLASNTETTLGTVPAGKIWKIYGGSIAGGNYDVTSGNGKYTYQLTAGSYMFLCAAHNSAGTTGNAYGTTNSTAVHFGPNYIQLAAGETVTSTKTGSGTAGTMRYIVYYVEETA